MTWTPWIQVYDPLGSPWLSTAAAAFPIVLLLVALALFELLRHAGRHLFRLADRSGLHAALRGRPVPHREHRAGRVWRNRHSNPDACGRNRDPLTDAWGHGRPPASIRVAHRARMARRDDERL